MSESVQKPRIRFKGFSDAWEQRKAKELFNSTADKGYPELPVLSATQDRGMIRRDENSINVFHDKKNELGYKRVLPGQFVIHLRSFQGGFAHSTIEGITSPAYTIFGISEPEKHDSEYWKYVFTSKEFIRRLETVTYGIRDGRSISYDEFLSLDFVYPSKAEQITIARSLDKLSNLITLHQREFFRLILAFFCCNSTSILPISWEQRKVGEVSESYSGGTPSVGVKEYYGGQIPFIRSAEINSEITELFLTEEGLKNSSARLVAVGDILYALYGATSGEVGRARLKGAINQAILAIKPHTDYDSEYLAQWLRKSKHSIIEIYLQGGQGNLSGTIVKELSVDFPSLKEQKAIGDFFRQLDNLITLHQRECLPKTCSLASWFYQQTNRKMTSFWEQRKLEDFFTERNERSGNGEMISVTIGSGIKKFDELNRFDKKPDDLSKYKRVEVGDIAYNSMRMWQGASGYSPYSGILSPAYTVITPKNGVSSRFFAYVLKQPKMIHQFEINSQGLTKDTWNLKFPAFAPIEVVAPLQLAEQEKVSELLLQLDNLITLHQRKYDKLVAVKKALLEKMFPADDETVPKIRFKGFSDAWEQRQFEDLYNYASEGGTPDTNNSSFYENGDVPFVKIEDTENKYIDSTKSYITQEGLSHSSAWLIPESSVIFTNGATVGNVAINRLPVATKQGILGIIPSKNVVTEFLFYLLSSATFQREVRSRMATGTFATIILKNLNQIPVCIPSDKSEQEEIAGYLSAFDNLITLHQRQLEKLKNIKSALLEKMFV